MTDVPRGQLHGWEKSSAVENGGGEPVTRTYLKKV